MKGYLFDGNVPSRLRFSPKLPIVPLSLCLRLAGTRLIPKFGNMHASTI